MKQLVRLSLILLAVLVPFDALAAASEAAHKELVKRYIETCLNGGDLACLEEFWTEERVAGVRKSEELRRSLFPDLSYELTEMIAEGDRVVVVVVVNGTHRGQDPLSESEGKKPIPPSYNTLQVNEAIFYSVVDGAIQRGRIISDKMAVAKALGYVIEPPGAE